MAESRPCVRRGVFFGQFGGCQDLGVVCSTASWASEEVKKANQTEAARLAVPSLVLLGQMELELLFKARACIDLTQGLERSPVCASAVA